MNGVAATHPTITTTIDAANTQKPVQDSLFWVAYMWLKLRSAPVVMTNATCTMMNSRNQQSTRKCTDRANWMLNTELIRRNRVDNAGDIPSPDSSASGVARKTVTK